MERVDEWTSGRGDVISVYETEDGALLKALVVIPGVGTTTQDMFLPTEDMFRLANALFLCAPVVPRPADD